MRPVPPFLARSTAQSSAIHCRPAFPLSSRTLSDPKKPPGYSLDHDGTWLKLRGHSSRDPRRLGSVGFYVPVTFVRLHSTSKRAQTRQSSLGFGHFFWGIIGALGLGAAGLKLFGPVQLALGRSRTPPESLDIKSSDVPDPTIRPTVSTMQQQQGEVRAAPGRPENLTPEQEEKLRQLWQKVRQVCGIEVEENDTKVEQESIGDAKKPKKKRLGIFSRRGKKGGAAESESAASPNGLLASPSKDGTSSSGDDDKYGQTQEFLDTLANQTPESIRATIWTMVKHDHPDALLLRFLRARKWDVEKALVMLVSTMNWRQVTMHVDDDIMRQGEAGALEQENSSTADAAARRLAHDFLEQIRMGKSFVHGMDRQGRPICVVRVRLHKQGEQVDESLERYTVYLIETCRMLLRPPVDTATIIFDMTGFTMANMDYAPVKFMIKCFEANYPECLGVVLVHKAPWIFQGIWKIIRGWLDPVVANKVHFTNSPKDLDEFIPRNRILKELDGDEDWAYRYVEPTPGENDPMKDTATRDSLMAARELLYKQYEDATLEWLQNPVGERAVSIKARRDEIAARLRDGYWELDPYVRARSYYDRTGVLLPGGKVDFYHSEATANGKSAEAKANGVAALAAAPEPVPVIGETSADDVD